MINNKKEFNWKTLPELFFEEAKKQLDKPLLWQKIDNEYIPYSWENVKKKILTLSKKLSQFGLKKGEKVSEKKYSLTGIGGFYPISLDIGIRVP